MEINVSASTASSPMLRMPLQSAGVDRGASTAAIIATGAGVEAAIFGPLLGTLLPQVIPHVPDIISGLGDLFGF